MDTTNFDELKKHIRRYAFDTNKVILNCGHFMLFTIKEYQNRVFTSIIGETSNDLINNYILKNFGDFSNQTFKMGTELYRQFTMSGKDCYLTLLVNDWQKIEKDTERSRSEPNKYRQAFYNDFKQPPKIYKRILSNSQLENIQWIGDNEDDFFFYRETRLRDRFKRKLKNLSSSQFFALDQQQCLTSCSEFEHNTELNSYYHVSTNSGIKKIAENGKVGCAGEVTQLISEIDAKEKDALLINILPYSCSESVNLGTEMAIEINPDLNLRMINIFPRDNNIPTSMIMIKNYTPVCCE